MFLFIDPVPLDSEVPENGTAIPAVASAREFDVFTIRQAAFDQDDADRVASDPRPRLRVVHTRR